MGAVGTGRHAHTSWCVWWSCTVDPGHDTSTLLFRVLSPSVPYLLYLLQVIGASIDSQFTHLAFSNTPRTKGGLGGCKYPLVADLTKQIAKVGWAVWH